MPSHLRLPPSRGGVDLTYRIRQNIHGENAHHGDALKRLLQNSRPHDRIPDHVDPALTKAAWAGVALLAIQFAIISITSHSSGGSTQPSWIRWALTGFGHPTMALWITGSMIVTALAGACFTRGFTRATIVGQCGQLGLVAAGLVAAIPTAWLVFIVCLVILAGIAMVLLGIAIVVAVVSDTS